MTYNQDKGLHVRIIFFQYLIQCEQLSKVKPVW